MTAAAQALAAQATTGAEATGQAPAQAPEAPANLPEWANGVAPEVGAWLLNKKFTGKKLSMQLPERPITGITPYTRDGIRYTIGVDIFESNP